ncbi:MAG: ABC transporter ATP-binding protein [Bdellovibrionales bacterium]|nr:ABC transporter ATP-binding protein [Bdellovibrionales bacterium]
MMIEVQNIQKSFKQKNNQLLILNNLNLQVPQGSRVGILGQSGSGKTTFLTLMAGLEKPDSGSIFVDKVDITKLSEDELATFRAKNLSIVFQQYHLISHLTALENVMLPLEILNTPAKEAQEKAQSLLAEVGLAERMDHFPAQLSGGESQRVAIARALITTPKFILADEPSGNLDQETGDRVMNLFMSVIEKHNITTLLVTHNLELADLCQTTYRLNHGHFEKLK